MDIILVFNFVITLYCFKCLFDHVWAYVLFIYLAYLLF